MKKLRLDQIVQGMYPQYSRSKIQSLIEKGHISIFKQSWKIETRSGAKFAPEELNQDSIRLEHHEELNYVSRGALKLKKAIEEFNIEVAQKRCLDVGLSTGGFTDVLLKSGASKVLGVDVGKEQLHPSLQKHPQLIYRDKVNAKEALPVDLLESFFDSDPFVFDLIVVDVSFISLTKVVPNLVRYMDEQSLLMTLVKPQFELEKSALNKKGVVKNESDLQRVQEKMIELIKAHGLELTDQCQSPIEGENGNKEFLFLSRRHSLVKPDSL